MSSLRFVVAVAALLSGALPTAAQVGSPACQTDLAAVDASFEETLARLGKITQATPVAEKCAAFKHHVEVMQNGIEVFDRCMDDGHDKGENIGQLGASIEDFQYIMQNQGCP